MIPELGKSDGTTMPVSEVPTPGIVYAKTKGLRIAMAFTGIRIPAKGTPMNNICWALQCIAIVLIWLCACLGIVSKAYAIHQMAQTQPFYAVLEQAMYQAGMIYGLYLVPFFLRVQRNGAFDALWALVEAGNEGRGCRSHPWRFRVFDFILFSLMLTTCILSGVLSYPQISFPGIPSDSPLGFFMRILAVIGLCFNSLIFNCIYGFFNLLLVTLITEFSTLNKEKLETSEEALLDRFAAHRRLCRAVREANSLFSSIVFITLSNFLAITLSSLYNIAGMVMDGDTSSAVQSAFGLPLILGFVFMLTLLPAALFNQIHGLEEKIEDMMPELLAASSHRVSYPQTLQM